jgi:hypothetical protein
MLDETVCTVEAAPPPCANPLTMLEWLRRVGLTMTGKFSCFRSFADLIGTESGEIVIVGGGPSLNDTVDRIREKKASGAKILAINVSHDWLIERGIVPDYAMMGDAREWVDYITPRSDVKYLLFSQLPEKTLERFITFAGNTYIAHTDPVMLPIGCTGADLMQTAYPGKVISVFSFGVTVGITALTACEMMGFDTAGCHGYDSSMKDDGTYHAYKKPVELGEKYEVALEALSSGEKRTFLVNGALELQLREFSKLMNWAGAGELKSSNGPWRMKIEVHGDGAFPWMVRSSPNSVFSVPNG